MTLASGARLGPYEVIAPVGSGGMGEVYRARDTRLGREVAIKVLPAERMADEHRRARFVQEARTASALNHPHIVTIYEIESAEGIPEQPWAPPPTCPRAGVGREGGRAQRRVLLRRGALRDGDGPAAVRGRLERPSAGSTVSADGETVLFAKAAGEGSDLMMIENFR